MTKRDSIKAKLVRIEHFLNECDPVDYLLTLRALAKRSSFAVEHPGMVDILIDEAYSRHHRRLSVTS
jgi:hypothetical protein